MTKAQKIEEVFDFPLSPKDTATRFDSKFAITSVFVKSE